MSKAAVSSKSPGAEPLRIVLADPDVSLHPTYREALAEEGFDVIAAHSGLECVAILRERAPDLLVLEPELPWGGGDGVLAIMGEAPHLAAVPVIVLTSCLDPQVMNRVAHFPVSGYHRKPLAPERLAGRLRSALEYPRLHCGLLEQAARLERAIVHRTGGRVWNLSIESVEGRFIIRGRCKSHYIKQLVVAAALGEFDGARYAVDPIEVNIEVASAPSRGP